MWQAVISFPQYAESGDWYVESLTLVDTVGNVATLDATLLASMGFPTTLTVTSVEDTTPPTLVDFALSPTSVDTSAGSAEVKVTMHITDAVSGVDFGPNPNAPWIMGFSSPVGNFIRICGGQTLTSGNPQDGVWELTCYWPQYSQAGIWTVWSLTLWDIAGNASSLGPDDLAASNFPSTVEVVSNPSDITPPVVSAFSFSPTFIDTSGADQNVTATISVTDDISGFSGLQVAFRSPSGAQSRSAYLYNPVSGDQFNGVFDGQVVFPQFSEAGTWKVQSLFYYDAVFNLKSLNTDDIAARGWPTVLNVVKPSLEADGKMPPGGGTVTDEVFGNRASLTLPPGAVAQDTDVAIDVLQSTLTFPMPAGFSAPGTFYVNVSFSPTPVMPFQAPGATVVLPLVNPLIPGTSLTLYTVDPVSGGLVVSVSVSGGPVVGTVDPGGLSATFSGVAHFSVVVGLFTDHVLPVVTPPADITVTETEAGGARGAASPALAAFLAAGTATDNVDLSPAPLSPQVSGADANTNTLFPLGATPVLFRFKDTAGNIGTATAKVTVVALDGAPPVVTPPADIAVEATGTQGTTGSASPALAAFLAAGTATDLVDPTPTRLAPQVAGLDATNATVFPLGTSTVTFRFQDDAGNVGTATATVKVVLASPVLSARAKGTKVQLTWTNVNAAANYAVYRGTTAGGPYARIALVPGSQLLYLDVDRTLGTTYYWVVRAVAAGGEEGAPSNEVMAKITGR